MLQNSHLVLCVDDELVGLKVRKILLERAGYQVLTAIDGASGLSLFEAEPIEAVVLDYSMPGMHGGEVASRMRGIKPNVPILLLRLHRSAYRSHVSGRSLHDQGRGALGPAPEARKLAAATRNCAATHTMTK